MTSPLTLTGPHALSRAWNTDGVPDPRRVVRVVIGDDQGRTTFHYDDGGTWVLWGLAPINDAATGEQP